ncbi:MAG TPA: hypothetical protein VKT73_10435 [Xanthobacteraceae bacterium]|nr:hypothetical protein [Xanthobacteraceae bacterium]
MNNNTDRNTLAIVGGVAFALAMQIILALIGLGAGVLAFTPLTSTTYVAAFIWWAVSGIVAAGFAGYLVALISRERDETTLSLLALLAWAITTVIVAALAGLSSSGGFLNQFGGPLGALLAQIKGASGNEFATKAIGGAALGSAAALVLGATAAVATAIETRQSLKALTRRR